MIRVLAYDSGDYIREIQCINNLCKDAHKAVMDYKFCHTESEYCHSCDFKEVCFDLKELGSWSEKTITKLEDIERNDVT